MNIAIYGGTFDPPHLGHYSIIREATKHVDRLLVIPAFQSPHKETAPTNPTDRLAMLQLLLQGFSNVTVDTLELERAARSYTYLTIQDIRAKYEASKIAIIIGADQYNALDTWAKFPEWKNSVEFIVFGREKYTVNVRTDIITTQLDAEFDNLSSTDIRNDIRQGKNIERLTGPAVATYIVQHNLYQ